MPNIPEVTSTSNSTEIIQKNTFGVFFQIDYHPDTQKYSISDMGNGYEMIYGQLENISCKKGDVIKTGSVIGKVAEPTNYFMLEGSHLYVKMTKDKKPVNPTDYFES